MSDRQGRYVEGPGPWCGTVGGYTHHRCRCLRCREAWNERRRQRYEAVNPPIALGAIVRHPRLGRGQVVEVTGPGRVRVRYTGYSGSGLVTVRECRTGVLLQRRPSVKPPNPKRAAVTQLRAQGYKPIVIARQVGVAESTVKRWLREAAAVA